MKKIKELVISYKNFSFKERANFNSKISMFGNFSMALIKFLLGLFTFSIPLCVSSLYSIGIGAGKQRYFKGITSEDNQNKYYYQICLIMIITSIVYIIYMSRLFFSDTVYNYSMITGIGIAAVSFTELVIAIKGLLKSKKTDDFLLKILKCINFTSALSAIVLTQVALLTIEKSPRGSFFNALAGVIFGSISILIFIYMLIRMLWIRKNKPM